MSWLRAWRPSIAWLVQGGTRKLLVSNSGSELTSAARSARQLQAVEDVATTAGSMAAGVAGAKSKTPMYMVVGFEVMACSIARPAGEKPKEISCVDEEEGRAPARQEITVGALPLLPTDPGSRESILQCLRLNSSFLRACCSICLVRHSMQQACRMQRTALQCCKQSADSAQQPHCCRTYALQL